MSWLTTHLSGRTILLWVAALVTGLSGFASLSLGHALQPGYLEIRLIEQDQYGVLWKVPAVKGRAMAITAQLPEQCEQQVGEQGRWNGAAFVSRWTTACIGGLEGGRITIFGLEKTATDVLVRFDLKDGSQQSKRLTASDIHFQVPSAPGIFEVVRTYFMFGIEHILLGIDHLMFVLILMLLVKDTRRLIATVTAFTVAHSLTLAGAVLGLIHVPGPPVEAAIALSIVFVAAEAIHHQRGQIGITQKNPWLIAFLFGLLHGFGFAGALTEIGLPHNAIPLALLFFNLGVEAGQLLFVFGVLIIFLGGRRILTVKNIPLTSYGWVILPYAIGSIAMFWVFERISGFLPAV